MKNSSPLRGAVGGVSRSCLFAAFAVTCLAFAPRPAVKAQTPAQTSTRIKYERNIVFDPVTYQLSIEPVPGGKDQITLAPNSQVRISLVSIKQDGSPAENLKDPIWYETWGQHYAWSITRDDGKDTVTTNYSTLPDKPVQLRKFARLGGDKPQVKLELIIKSLSSPLLRKELNTPTSDLINITEPSVLAIEGKVSPEPPKDAEFDALKPYPSAARIAAPNQPSTGPVSLRKTVGAVWYRATIEID